MKQLTIPVMAFSLLALGFAQAGHTQASPGDRSQTVEIMRSGSQPSTEGSADSFTGSVRINPLFPAHDPSRVSGASVTFDPGARTAWHTHPLVPIFFVTVGARADLSVLNKKWVMPKIYALIKLFPDLSS